MHIYSLSGIDANSPVPRLQLTESDMQMGRIPNLPDGTRLGRHWWQADRSWLKKDPLTGRAVWFDRWQGTKLTATAGTWPTRDAVFTSTPATGSETMESFTVAGGVRMNGSGNLLDADANTIYMAIKPTTGASSVIRYFGSVDAVSTGAPTDDVLNFGAFNGLLRLLTEDASGAVLSDGTGTDRRGTTFVVRVAKSTTYGSSIAVNGTEVARDAAKNSSLINRTFALFGLGNGISSTQFYGSIRHLMIFAGADFSADPYYSASDAVVTARLKADVGVV